MGKKVAVIGGGLSGLATLKYLSECPAVSEIVGFERYGYVGGMWVYNERTGIDVDGLPVHSAAYKDLRTNGPKISLMISDFPFQNPRPSFIMHDELRDYLEAFADHFKLRQYIRFNTTVTKVTPLSPGNRDTRWTLASCTSGKPETSTSEDFDVVVVCNGHCWLPYEPEVDGRDKFKGIFIHARDFRVTDPFKDKTVVLFGAGITTTDLMPILAPIAKRIIISEGPNALQFTAPDNVCRKPSFCHVTETSVVFDNGEEEHVDAIILCTGYRYGFPFLSEDCGIVLKDEDRRVTPLYKHIVNTTHPSLMFVGIIDYAFNIACYDKQARFVAKVLDGTVKLPDKSEMDEDTEKEFDSRSKGTGSLAKSCNFHKLFFLQGEYCDQLSALANTPTMPKYLRELLEYMMKESLPKEPATYKEHNYEVSGDTFVEI